MITVGDALEIKLDEFVVAQGTVAEIADGKVYIDIPATRVVMGLKTSLGDLDPEVPAVEHRFMEGNPIVGDGGSEAKDQVNAVEVPPDNGTRDTTPQVPQSNDSLRSQTLDSSALD